MSNSGSAFGGNQSYNRDRFGGGRPHPGKVQKRDDYKKQDFKVLLDICLRFRTSLFSASEFACVIV